MQCDDTCPIGIPTPVDGICGCGNDKTMFNNLDGSVLCCDEGQVNNNGNCEDRCPAGMPLPVNGVCGCGLNQVTFMLNGYKVLLEIVFLKVN